MRCFYSLGWSSIFLFSFPVEDPDCLNYFPQPGSADCLLKAQFSMFIWPPYFLQRAAGSRAQVWIQGSSQSLRHHSKWWCQDCMSHLTCSCLSFCDVSSCWWLILISVNLLGVAEWWNWKYTILFSIISWNGLLERSLFLASVWLASGIV